MSMTLLAVVRHVDLGNVTTVSWLPEEVIKKIISLLTARELIRVCFTCHHMFYVGSDAELWLSFFQAEFGKVAKKKGVSQKIRKQKQALGRSFWRVQFVKKKMAAKNMSRLPEERSLFDILKPRYVSRQKYASELLAEKVPDESPKQQRCVHETKDILISQPFYVVNEHFINISCLACHKAIKRAAQVTTNANNTRVAIWS